MADDAPDYITASPSTWAAYRDAFRCLGPRHRLLDRWCHDLGWEIPHEVAAPFLAPEMPRTVNHG